MTYRLVKIQVGLVSQNPTSKDLVVVSAAQVYLDDKVTLATVYSDTTGTVLTNSPSVPTGVADGAPGVDAQGNLVYYGDPTKDYAYLVNGHFLPERTTSIHHADFTDHVDGTVTDPHGDRAYALGLNNTLSTTVTNNGNAITAIQAWTAGSIPVDTTNGAQGPNIQAAIDALVAGGGSGDVLVD